MTKRMRHIYLVAGVHIHTSEYNIVFMINQGDMSRNSERKCSNTAANDDKLQALTIHRHIPPHRQTNMMQHCRKRNSERHTTSVSIQKHIQDSEERVRHQKQQSTMTPNQGDPSNTHSNEERDVEHMVSKTIPPIHLVCINHFKFEHWRLIFSATRGR